MVSERSSSRNSASPPIAFEVVFVEPGESLIEVLPADASSRSMERFSTCRPPTISMLWASVRVISRWRPLFQHTTFWIRIQMALPRGLFTDPIPDLAIVDGPMRIPYSQPRRCLLSKVRIQRLPSISATSQISTRLAELKTIGCWTSTAANFTYIEISPRRIGPPRLSVSHPLVVRCNRRRQPACCSKSGHSCYRLDSIANRRNIAIRCILSEYPQ